MTIIELISDICTIGGGQTLTKNLSISISKQRQDIKVIIVSLYTKTPSPIVDELEKHGIPIIYLNKKRGIDIKCAARLKRVVNQIKPDIIHAHLSTILTLYLSKITKKYKTYYTFHSVVNNNGAFPDRINNSFIKKMMKNHSIIPVAISPIVARTITAFFGVEYPIVIFNGVDTSVFFPKPHFFERQYDFAVVGSFSEVKNQKQILDILNTIYKKGHLFKAVFLGDGPLKDECMGFVQKNSLNNVIMFKGNVGDTFNYLKDSYFLVMKSLFEGNPMVINEAIACGTFVISNNVGGIPDVIDSSTGCIIDKNDDDAFEQALINLLEAKKDILKRVQANLEENRNKVSIDRLSLCYLKLFEGEFDGKL